jgi:hypothetical protein
MCRGAVPLSATALLLALLVHATRPPPTRSHVPKQAVLATTPQRDGLLDATNSARLLAPDAEHEPHAINEPAAAEPGGLTFAPGDPIKDASPRAADADEKRGMNELFDDLDADNDDNFEKAELSNMLVELGLDTKQGSQQPWKWQDALQKMDHNQDTFLSKLEVINHMKKLVMSRRQVADWMKYSVGLPVYIATFAENSVTGFLKYELGITSSLHRKQIRRAILNRMFGFAPDKPEGLSCEPGSEPGSVLVFWEESESDDEGEDLIYRLRRQDPRTKEWCVLQPITPVRPPLQTL